MSEFQKLVDADHRFEEAVEMLRDLLGEGNQDRLVAALQEFNPSPARTGRRMTRADLLETLLFLGWLGVGGEEHLDGMLAEIHGIDEAAVENERSLRRDIQRRAARKAIARHQESQASRARRLRTELAAVERRP